MSPVQQGVPLDPLTLGNMPQEEQDFWNDFLSEADQVLCARDAGDATPPYPPTASLNMKYKIAVEKYDGEKYCQMRQLKQLFTFG